MLVVISPLCLLSLRPGGEATVHSAPPFVASPELQPILGGFHSPPTFPGSLPSLTTVVFAFPALLFLVGVSWAPDAGPSGCMEGAVNGEVSRNICRDFWGHFPPLLSLPLL